MEQRHRDVIAKNLSTLVTETDVEEVCNSLRRKKVFNERMAEPFLDKSTPRSERAQEMYTYIETRGPQAFQALVNTLIETSHTNQAKLLDPNCNPEAHLHWFRSPENAMNGLTILPQDNDVTPNNNHSRCHPNILPQYMINENPDINARLKTMGSVLAYDSLINVGTVPRPVVVIQAKERLDRGYKQDLHVYPMGSRPKGLLLLINNVNFEDSHQWNHRKGADVDTTNLCSLFIQLGYTVFSHKDKTHQEMTQLVEEFSTLPQLRQVSSVVVAIMSHGVDNSHIMTHDCMPLDTEWIIRKFDGEHSPDLLLKPKVFLFQTCRGLELQTGVASARLVANKRTRTDGQASDVTHARTTGDMLIAHSTLPGYSSNRDEFLGTWFIQAVCEVFAQNAHDTDIEDMLKMVDSRLSRLKSEIGTMQTTCYENRGFKKLFFIPGLYDSPSPESPIPSPPFPVVTASEEEKKEKTVNQSLIIIPDESISLLGETISMELTTNQISYVA